VIKTEDIPPSTESMEAALNRFLLNQAFTIEAFTAAYRELMKVALMQIFFWPVFEGEFAKAKILHDTFASVRISELMLEASRTLVDYQKVKTEVPLYGYIGRTSHYEEMLSTLNLKPEESFIVSRLEGDSITLNTLNLMTGLPEEKIARLVYVMEKIGAVKFVDPASQRPAPRRAETPAPPPQGHPPQATPTPPPAAHASPVGKTSPPGKTKLTDSFVAALGRRFVDAPPASKGPPLPKKEPTSPEMQQVRMEVNKSETKTEADVHLKVAEQFYELAEENYELADYWKSIQLSKQAIKNNPTQAKYYVLIARAYAKHPKFGKDAEQNFYKAIELDPWNPDFHMELANFYLNNGLSKRAINMCQRALKIAPNHEAAKKLYHELSAKH
jgi:Tfp pilus assembly protein PilF